MPINQVTGIASQLLIKAIQQKLELQGFPEMQLGETLEAKVAQKLDGNKVVVMIKGSQITADATIPLQVGQKINVQVETLKPQILLRLITGPAGGGQIRIAGGYLKALRSDPQATAALQLGETLQAQVSQKLDGDKVVVTLKGTQMSVDTTIPLQVGQKINVQVERLQPQILLRLISADAAGEQGKINGYLKAFRSDPQAFNELFLAGGTLLSPDSLKTLSNGLLRHQSQSLGQMIQTLIFSTETMNNPSFIRDFVARSGLLLEHTLGKALQENPAGEIKVQPGGDNLKSALIKFGAEIRAWLSASPDLPEGEMTTLLRLAEYTDRSVHTLETQQVLNVVSREQENRFMVQIPFAFPQSLTMQDIFIEFDGRQGEEKEGGSPFRVVFFLNLDALGEMMIDVGIRGQDLSADLSCQSVDTMAFVSASLEELKKNLDSLGFRVVRMTCDVRDDIGPARQDYVRNSSLYEGDVINFFA